MSQSDRVWIDCELVLRSANFFISACSVNALILLIYQQERLLKNDIQWLSEKYRVEAVRWRRFQQSRYKYVLHYVYDLHIYATYILITV